MLKIKDNVDLKELEKFGFMYDKGYEWQDIICYKYVDDDYCIEAFKDEIRMYIFEDGLFIDVPEILYDLIKADLVEKIGEDK